MPSEKMMKQGNEEVGLLQLLMLTTLHPERDIDYFEMLHHAVGMQKSPMNGGIVLKRRLLL